MRLFYIILPLFFASLSIGFAQESLKGKHIEEIKISQLVKKELHIKYELKDSKETAPLMKVKFSNKTKKNLNVDLVMGIYSNGVLIEKADIADCLKKSFFSNLFRPYHLVETSIKENQDIEIKVLNIYTEQVDECRQIH